MPDEIELTEEEDRNLDKACDVAGAPYREALEREYQQKLKDGDPSVGAMEKSYQQRLKERLAAESELQDEPIAPDDVEEAKRP